MNLDQMTVIELKALAFDELVQIEQSQKNIQMINQKIQEKPKKSEPLVVVDPAGDFPVGRTGEDNG